MRIYYYILFGFVGFSVLSFCVPHSSTELTVEEVNLDPIISSTKVNEAMVYAKKNGMDTTIAFFIDFSIPSGKNRLFVYNFKKGEILKSTLCAHGSGNKGFSSSDEVIFSNVPESHYSSIGKYKVGARGWSNTNYEAKRLIY